MRKINFLISTCFGFGMIPWAPGTFGTIAGLLTIIFYSFYFPTYALYITPLIAIISLLIGIPSSNYAAKYIFHKKDPSQVVIDEFSGIYFSLIWIPIKKDMETLILLSSAFILFRFFDIFKPWVIDKSQKLKGGMGIMIDDILSGLVTLVIVHTIKYYIIPMINV